ALLAPNCANEELSHAARQVAEAWLYCQKVSRARSEVIAATNDAKGQGCSSGEIDEPTRGVKVPRASIDRLARYERRAFNQLEAALERLQLLFPEGIR